MNFLTTYFLILLAIPWVSAQSERPTGTAGTAPTDQPVTQPGEPDTAGTVNPHQPQDAEALLRLCGTNEEYKICGKPCELTCDDPTPDFICVSRGCVRGCQCKNGYYRNDRGRCVRLFNCPPKDPVTCATLLCQRGYVCRMTRGTAQCVPITPQCKPNESYLECGSACEPSCSKPNPGVCTLQCVAGCRCDSGYYRNDKGDCVKLSDCPPAPITCALVLCPKGYICKVNNGKAECVSVPQCKSNESYLTCGTACEPSCDKPNPTVCTDNCVAGCQCNSGYYRNKQGNCIRLSDCPVISPVCNLLCIRGFVCKIVQGKAQCVPDNLTCKSNEVFTQCKSPCEPSCDKPKPTICPDFCAPGCQCIDGYYRNSNGNCVKLTECPPKEPAACQGKQCTTPGGCALVIPIFCIIGLCTPQPTCVNTNPCASTICAVGQECALRQVICIFPPCNPVAECISSTSSTCPQNEQQVACKNSCSEGRCDNTPQVFCPRFCIGSPGCACKSGYVRSSSGKCVTPQQC